MGKKKWNRFEKIAEIESQPQSSSFSPKDNKIRIPKRKKSRKRSPKQQEIQRIRNFHIRTKQRNNLLRQMAFRKQAWDELGFNKINPNFFNDEKHMQTPISYWLSQSQCIQFYEKLRAMKEARRAKFAKNTTSTADDDDCVLVEEKRTTIVIDDDDAEQNELGTSVLESKVDCVESSFTRAADAIDDALGGIVDLAQDASITSTNSPVVNKEQEQDLLDEQEQMLQVADFADFIADIQSSTMIVQAVSPDDDSSVQIVNESTSEQKSCSEGDLDDACKISKMCITAETNDNVKVLAATASNETVPRTHSSALILASETIQEASIDTTSPGESHQNADESDEPLAVTNETTTETIDMSTEKTGSKLTHKEQTSSACTQPEIACSDDDKIDEHSVKNVDNAAKQLPNESFSIVESSVDTTSISNKNSDIYAKASTSEDINRISAKGPEPESPIDSIKTPLSSEPVDDAPTQTGLEETHKNLPHQEVNDTSTTAIIVNKSTTGIPAVEPFENQSATETVTSANSTLSATKEFTADSYKKRRRPLQNAKRGLKRLALRKLGFMPRKGSSKQLSPEQKEAYRKLFQKLLTEYLARHTDLTKPNQQQSDDDDDCIIIETKQEPIIIEGSDDDAWNDSHDENILETSRLNESTTATSPTTEIEQNDATKSPSKRRDRSNDTEPNIPTDPAVICLDDTIRGPDAQDACMFFEDTVPNPVVERSAVPIYDSKIVENQIILGVRRSKRKRKQTDDSVVFVSEETAPVQIILDRCLDFVPVGDDSNTSKKQQNKKPPPKKVRPGTSKDIFTAAERKRMDAYNTNAFNPNTEEPKSGKRMVIIDGCNVAFSHSINKEFSVRGLEIAIEAIKKLGNEVKVVIPQVRMKKSKSTDQALLDKLHNEGYIVLTPCKSIPGKQAISYDDRCILQLAVQLDAAIVSNDQYRDLINENEAFKKVIESRVIGFIWCKDVFMLPKDPYGRNGPSLDAILSGK